MSFKVVVFTALVAAALARPEGTPGYSAPAPSYPAPRPTYGAPDQYADAPAVYNSQYAVRDDPSGNDYGQQEARDEQKTQGVYYVALPDGRVQKVTYYVSGDSGYVAEVTYEGEAQYPPTKQYQAPEQSYKPAPTPAYG